MDTKAKTILIDGNNLLYRTFWAANYKTEGDDPKRGIYIFLNSLKSYADKFGPWENIYCVWDKRIAYPKKNFRSEVCETEYKGGRDNEKFKNIFDSLDEIIDILISLGVYNFYPWCMEADDAISWLSSYIEGEKIIISTDKDMLQLINDKVNVYNPNSKKIINEDNFEETTKLKSPRDYFWYRCFTGDKSDNIQGIKRFGLKTYQKLTKNWDYENLDELNITDEQKQIVEKNQKLMDLSYGYNVYPEETVTYKAQYYQNNQRKTFLKVFIEQCEKLGFNSIIEKKSNWYSTFETVNKSGLFDSVNIIKERINKKC